MAPVGEAVSRITVDGRRFTLTPDGAHGWLVADEAGLPLGVLNRVERDETRTSMRYRNGRAYSGTIRKVTAVYWVARMPGTVPGRVLESRAAAIRWLRNPPAWWVEQQKPAEREADHA